MPTSLAADPATQLHLQIVDACRTMQAATRQLALLLAQFHAARLFRDLGYGSVREYAEIELGLSSRRAGDLLALGKRLPELPALDEALSTGAIGWTKARELLRVSTPQTDAAWVERAQSVSSRVLEQQVSASRKGDEPPDEVRAREAEQLPRRRVLRFEVEPCDARLIEDAMALLRERSGLAAEEVGDGVLLAQALQRVIVEDEGDATPTGPRHQVAIQHCPSCEITAGLDSHVGATEIGLAVCDAEVVDMRPGPNRGKLTRAIPPKVRRAVIIRDQRTCVVPGCTNRLWLDLHHLRSRAQGGTHIESNLVTICSGHHQAIHDGNLALRPGREPGVVEVERRNGGIARVRLGVGLIESTASNPRTATALFSWGMYGFRV